MFVGEPAINFDRAHKGALGRSITWASRPADPATGRVDLSDFKQGAGDRGGFGYDRNGSPGPLRLRLRRSRLRRRGPGPPALTGSSGTLIVTVNEQIVYQYNNFAGRAYAPGTDLVRVALAKGRNRILVVCRQGIGPWCFGLQIARVAPAPLPAVLPPSRSKHLRNFALRDGRRSQEGRNDLLRRQGRRLRPMPYRGRAWDRRHRPRPDRPGREIRPGRGDPVDSGAIQPHRHRLSARHRRHSRRPGRDRRRPLRDRHDARAGRRRDQDHQDSQVQHRRPPRGRCLHHAGEACRGPFPQPSLPTSSVFCSVSSSRKMPPIRDESPEYRETVLAQTFHFG